jgi:hypothetical protein
MPNLNSGTSGYTKSMTMSLKLYILFLKPQFSNLWNQDNALLRMLELLNE